MLAMTSCEKYDDLVPSEYHHILNIKQYGMQRISLYTTGEDAVYKFTVMKGGSEPNSPATGLVEAMSEEEYKTYAEQNNVAEAYLPADMYQIKENQLNFAADETYKINEVTLKTSEIKKLMDKNKKHYALPIRMTSSDCTVKNELLVLQLDIETPELKFKLSGGNKYVAGATFTTDKTDKQTAQLQVVFATQNLWDFTFDAQTDEKAKQAFEAYNKAADGRYTLLPKEAYQFKNQGISFPKNTTSMTLSISIDPKKLNCGEYILPLHLSNISNENFKANEENDVVLVGIKFIPKKLNLKVSQLSTNSVENGDGTGLAGLIDGDVDGGGYFHSKWSAPVKDATYGNYIDVNIGKTLHSLSFEYWTRKQNGNGAPKHIKLFVSNDGKTWKEWKSIKKGLPGGGHAKYSSSIFTYEEGFSHVRFAVIESAAGNMTTTATYFNLHELTFYGE
ncbi:protein containing Region of unknown function DUF1735 [gut metagenome]|uniref:F5/8 type C domain-containing protein n=1 Tax=gut metagenome TaxID=749906 RepID=J9GNI6_9ZZZZ